VQRHRHITLSLTGLAPQVISIICIIPKIEFDGFLDGGRNRIGGEDLEWWKLRVIEVFRRG